MKTFKHVWTFIQKFLKTMMDIFIPLLLKTQRTLTIKFSKKHWFSTKRGNMRLECCKVISLSMKDLTIEWIFAQNHHTMINSVIKNVEEINIFHKNIKENKMEFKKNSNLLNQMFLKKINVWFGNFVVDVISFSMKYVIIIDNHKTINNDHVFHRRDDWKKVMMKLTDLLSLLPILRNSAQCCLWSWRALKRVDILFKSGNDIEI